MPSKFQQQLLRESETPVGPRDGAPDGGPYWERIDPDIKPNYWVRYKKICKCPEHKGTQWPVDHVIITIPSCGFKCPYCPIFDQVSETNRFSAIMVRRHINVAHVQKEAAFYVGLQVARSTGTQNFKCSEKLQNDH